MIFYSNVDCIAQSKNDCYYFGCIKLINGCCDKFKTLPLNGILSEKTEKKNEK